MEEKPLEEAQRISESRQHIYIKSLLVFVLADKIVFLRNTFFLTISDLQWIHMKDMSQGLILVNEKTFWVEI